MNIGIDVDGVLADFNVSYQKVLIGITQKNLFGTLPYDPPEWNYVEPLGYTKEDDQKAWDWIKISPMFWRDLPRYPEAANEIGRLISLSFKGHSVYYITNRMGNNPKHQTERWLYRNGYMVSTHAPTVLVTAHKGLAAAALELDCYIDDKPSNCEDVIKQRGLKTATYLMDRTWNQRFEGKYITRVKSISEMLDAELKAEVRQTEEADAVAAGS